MNGNIISNLRFADDIAATMESKGELQSLMKRIVEESGKNGHDGQYREDEGATRE